MSFISIVDKNGKTHWINPKNIEQISEDSYREGGSKLYFTSGRYIEFNTDSDDVVDMIIGRMANDSD